MMGLHSILQNECALLCYRHKLTIKSISAFFKEGQLQSPSMECFYLSLYVLNWGASLLPDIPQYPCVFAVQVAQQVVELVLISHLTFKSLTQEHSTNRPMKRPGI